MWSVWLVFWDCSFHSLCPLRDKERRFLMGKTHCVGETGSSSDGRVHAPFSSVAQSCLTLCDPMDCSTPGLPVHHQLPELTHIHVLWWWCNPTISFSVVPFSSCPQSFSRHQSLFQSVSSSHHVVKVLELQLQHQSFQWILRTDFLEDRLVWFPCGPRDRQESSPTLQFKSINSLALRFLYGPTLTSIHDHWKNHSFD